MMPTGVFNIGDCECYIGAVTKHTANIILVHCYPYRDMLAILRSVFDKLGSGVAECREIKYGTGICTGRLMGVRLEDIEKLCN